MEGVDHLDLVVGSLEQGLAFYGELLEPLGYVRRSEIEGERGERVVYLGRHGGAGSLSLREHLSDAHATPYDRYAIGLHHVAFAAGSRALVDEVAARARELGAQVESGPQEYGYTPGYYAVFVHDPDGLKIEVVHRPSARAADATRTGYAHVEAIATRWADNDVYGHVNNVEYLAFFDTAINAWLVREGGLDIHGGEVIGLCAESHCVLHGAIAFPDAVEAALRVGHLGRRSVRYELALFRAGEGPAIADGWFVHAFVERATRRPVEIPPRLRGALERLVVRGPKPA